MDWHCRLCGELMPLSKVNWSSDWKGLVTTFLGVPGYKCNKCAHTVFDPKVVDSMGDYIDILMATEQPIPAVINYAEVVKKFSIKD